MISDRHKRLVYRVWILLAVLFGCAQFLECVRAVQMDRQAFQTEINLKDKWMILSINRCIPHSSSTNPNTKCIAEVRDHFDSLSEEQKTQPYYVSIANRSTECGSGCCEALMVRLVEQLAEIEGLCVKELAMKRYCTLSTPMPEDLFTENPGPSLVVEDLSIDNLSSACFHSVCSVVQVCAPDIGRQYGVMIIGVPHIDFARYPLKYPWIVRSVEVVRAKTVDLGSSVHRLPREGKAEDSAGPGLWVRGEVEIHDSRNCCMPGSTVDLIERGIPLAANMTSSFGIAVPEGTTEAELPRAVYRAVCAIRRVEVGENTQRYVVVPHEAYKEKAPKALKELAEQLSSLLENDAEQETDRMSSRVVEIRGAPEGSSFMRVCVERSREEVMIPWVVRVEQRVLRSAEACSAAIAKLVPHGANICVMEAIAVLRSVEEALRRSPKVEITGERWMTLFPCGCFKEDALNEAWHRRARGCKGKSSGSIPYRYFPRITLSRQPNGSVRMAMPRAVPVFAMPEAQSPVYQVREIGEHSIEIRMTGMPEGVCAGATRRQYITQIYPEIIDVIRERRMSFKRFGQYFQRIVFTADGPMSPANWLCVCMYVLETLGKESVYAGIVEIGGTQKGAEERSTACEKAVYMHLLTEQARFLEACSVRPLKTNLLCVEEPFAEHLPLLSRVVCTDNLLVVLVSEEGAQVQIPEEGGVGANPSQPGASSSITAPSSSISAIMEHLGKCKWQLDEVCVRGRDRARRGAAPASVGLKAVQGGRLCKRVVFERELVFESLEEIAEYFEWKKRTELGQESAVKEYPGLKITMNDLKKVWIDDRAYDPAGDWRPRIQAYLEALIAWYPTGAHVVFQVRISKDTKYDITQTYDFYPQSHQEKWYQVCPGTWQIELEVCECSKKTDGVVSTAQHRIYLAHEFPAELEYSWVHVPGWAMTTKELKKKTVKIIEDQFGDINLKDVYLSTATGRIDCLKCGSRHKFVGHPNNTDFDVTVLRCRHIYHRKCFEMMLDDCLNSSVPNMCSNCRKKIRRGRQAALVGRIGMRPAKKKVSSEDALEVVPDYSHVVDGRDITWIILGGPGWEESEEAG